MSTFLLVSCGNKQDNITYTQESLQKIDHTTFNMNLFDSFSFEHSYELNMLLHQILQV
jgi:hypothetical protein